MSIKKDFFNRFTALIVIMIFVFTLLLSQLVHLQIVNAEDNQQKADTKGITEIDEPAPRGDIVDKNNVVLATSKQTYTLTFTQTDESNLYFYHTMDKIFKILDDAKDIQTDDFDLKVNPYSFNFNTDNADAKKQLELRFKKDRGLNDDVQKSLFPKKEEKDLTSEENAKIDTELLKLTPEYTFNYLAKKKYNITPEGILENYAKLYKTNSKAALEIIKSDYKITSEADVKALLEKYKITSKADDKKSILVDLGKKCNISQKTLTIAQQRRYMLIKDAIKMQSYSGSKPITIANNIKQSTAFLISQQLTDLPGIDITMQPVREYPMQQLASGILGYMSKISSNQEKYEEKGYNVSTDYVGISGIESALEDELKGSKGTKIVKINSSGRVTEELGTKDAYAGNTVKLTIDSNLQYAAQTALTKTMQNLQAEGKHLDVDSSNATRGAAVAVDIKTGAILALVSNPGFNPNDFVNSAGLSNDLFQKYFKPDLESFGKSKGYSQDKIDKLFPIDKTTGSRTDKYDIVSKPLFNYATSSLTPTGSTFKPLTAIAGLESGVINPSTKIDDQAKFNDGHGFNVNFSTEKANGLLNLSNALAVSSNPYFMTVGKLLRDKSGNDALANYAWKFGLGSNPTSKTQGSTGIEISEKFGQVYNTYSSTQNYATSYLYSAMNALKSGKDYKGSSFTPIELHINGDEDDDVKEARQKLRDLIQETIKDGNVSKNHNTFMDLMTDLIKTDDLYKGKDISKTEITKIVKEIEYVVIDGHSQIANGSNVYNASIGQGDNQFTPIQLANYVATIANGGKRYKLHLVDEVTDPNTGKVIQKTEPEVVEDTGIKQSTLDAVIDGMKKVTGDGGTASKVFDGFPIQTAGKTGTAQYRDGQDDLGRTNYSVYIGFAPADKPQIAVSVIIFDGGYGNDSAPVAKSIYEAYFKDELKSKGYAVNSDAMTAKPITGN